jgi:hypothetical protein
VPKQYFLISIILLMSACSTTKLVDEWQADEFHRSDLHKVLIVSVSDNLTYRTLFETEFEKVMLADGVEGTTALKAIGDGFPTQEKIEAYVVHHDINYIISTRVEDIEIDKDYVPPEVRTYYIGPYYPSFGHYYAMYPGETVTMIKDGYVDTRETVHLVTTIFDAKTYAPVWIGRSATFEPGSVLYLAEDIAIEMWRDIAH